MAKIIFFEKTGCINNTKQKKILMLAGHDVEAVDLVNYNWTKEELISFFKDLKVDEWFNLNAPQVQSGEVNPKDFTEDSAISAMLKDHLLIKRPLLIIGSNRIAGFDTNKIEALAGLNSKQNEDIKFLLKQNLSDCPQKYKGLSCD